MANTKKIKQTIEKTLNESSKTIECIGDLSNEIDKIESSDENNIYALSKYF